MNEILQLKGHFEQRKNDSRPKAANIPKNSEVNIDHLINLKNNLKEINNFWNNETLSIKPLVSVHYNDIIAKSNRIKGILDSSSQKNNNSIVGAKYSHHNGIKHIITHCVERKIIIDAIKKIERVINIIENHFGKCISHDDINEINKNKYTDYFSREDYSISKTRFVNIVVDAYYVEKFSVEKNTSQFDNNSIITIYDTGVKTEEIFKQLDIEFLNVKSIDETTLLLTPDQFNLLKTKAPYLISMAVSDISKLELEEVNEFKKITHKISDPTNEPTIGVIDTMFDNRVYFSKWVEFKNMLDPNIELNEEDFQHGTMVSSIIVDGSNINPELNDGCGHFKVRHFGVAKSGYSSSFTILRLIKEIVETNKDIKVWNLSLGSSMEIDSNFISPEAAILDKIQYENNVIFVVAGTNKSVNANVKKIGAPADSINSLVVNSVSLENKPSEYSREGTVLSFFNKPDVSYYGGEGGEGSNRLKAYSPLGDVFVKGTSFAAPWIARKLAFLIEILGLSRELAKALIIDSASGWNDKLYSSNLIGYGVVPIHIDEIVKTPDDEIKFLINGISEKYDTYNYNIPIPEYKEKQPYISKATLCYFPKCSRNQGVDYTNTEMDIHFGRLTKTKTGSIKINSINENRQSDKDRLVLYEGTARKVYRKWDNIKHIRETLLTPTGKKRKLKEKQNNGLWGISIKTKERLNSGDGENLQFGLVVTLKEINGVNRIEEFIQQCLFRGWIVNRIDIENRIDIYNLSEETIEFK